MEMRKENMNIAPRILAACKALQGPRSEAQAAENFLMQFRTSSRPYVICKSIMVNTTDPFVAFHMIATIQVSLLREWSQLEPEFITTERDGLLTFAVNKSMLFPKYVRNKLVQTVAIIYKRSFLSRIASEKVTDILTTHEFLNRLSQLLDLPHIIENAKDPKEIDGQKMWKRIVGMELCLAMIHQFSSTCRPPGGTLPFPLHYHLHCHQIFETSSLPTIINATFSLLRHSLTILSGSAQKIACPRNQLEWQNSDCTKYINFLIMRMAHMDASQKGRTFIIFQMIVLCIKTIAAVLSWDFGYGDVSERDTLLAFKVLSLSSKQPNFKSNQKTDNASHIVYDRDNLNSGLQPGADWADFLVHSPQLSEVLCTTYRNLVDMGLYKSHGTSSWPKTSILQALHNIRTIFLHLVSLAGNVFSNDKIHQKLKAKENINNDEIQPLHNYLQYRGIYSRRMWDAIQHDLFKRSVSALGSEEEVAEILDTSRIFHQFFINFDISLLLSSSENGSKMKFLEDLTTYTRWLFADVNISKLGYAAYNKAVLDGLGDEEDELENTENYDHDGLSQAFTILLETWNELALQLQAIDFKMNYRNNNFNVTICIKDFTCQEQSKNLSIGQLSKAKKTCDVLFHDYVKSRLKLCSIFTQRSGENGNQKKNPAIYRVDIRDELAAAELAAVNPKLSLVHLISKFEPRIQKLKVVSNCQELPVISEELLFLVNMLEAVLTVKTSNSHNIKVRPAIQILSFRLHLSNQPDYIEAAATMLFDLVKFTFRLCRNNIFIRLMYGIMSTLKSWLVAFVLPACDPNAKQICPSSANYALDKKGVEFFEFLMEKIYINLCKSPPHLNPSQYIPLRNVACDILDACGTSQSVCNYLGQSFNWKKIVSLWTSKPSDPILLDYLPVPIIGRFIKSIFQIYDKAKLSFDPSVKEKIVSDLLAPIKYILSSIRSIMRYMLIFINNTTPSTITCLKLVSAISRTHVLSYDAKMLMPFLLETLLYFTDLVSKMIVARKSNQCNSTINNSTAYESFGQLVLGIVTFCRELVVHKSLVEGQGIQEGITLGIEAVITIFIEQNKTIYPRLRNSGNEKIRKIMISFQSDQMACILETLMWRWKLCSVRGKSILFGLSRLRASLTQELLNHPSVICQYTNLLEKILSITIGHLHMGGLHRLTRSSFIESLRSLMFHTNPQVSSSAILACTHIASYPNPGLYRQEASEFQDSILKLLVLEPQFPSPKHLLLLSDCLFYCLAIEGAAGIFMQFAQGLIGSFKDSSFPDVACADQTRKYLIHAFRQLLQYRQDVEKQVNKKEKITKWRGHLQKFVQDIRIRIQFG